MEHKIYEELKAIREIRKKKKLSQQEVAEKAKCHQSYYSRAERGKMNVSMEELTNILAALGAKLIIKG